MTFDLATLNPLALSATPLLANVWGTVALSLGVVFFLVVSIVMVLVVLIQKPQGGGLSGAFGSDSGSGQTAFGAKTGDALTTITVGVFLVFIITASVLNLVVKGPQIIDAEPAATGTETGGGAGTGDQSGSAPADTPPEVAPEVSPAVPPATTPETPPVTPADSDAADNPAPEAPATGDGAGGASGDAPAEPASEPGATPGTNPGR